VVTLGKRKRKLEKESRGGKGGHEATNSNHHRKTKEKKQQKTFVIGTFPVIKQKGCQRKSLQQSTVKVAREGIQHKSARCQGEVHGPIEILVGLEKEVERTRWDELDHEQKRKGKVRDRVGVRLRKLKLRKKPPLHLEEIKGNKEARSIFAEGEGWGSRSYSEGSHRGRKEPGRIQKKRASTEEKKKGGGGQKKHKGQNPTTNLDRRRFCPRGIEYHLSKKNVAAKQGDGTQKSRSKAR